MGDRNLEGHTMDRRTLAASVLTAALGFAATAVIVPASAANKDQMAPSNGQQAAAASMQKCYGINAVAKNDCAAGAHSCAGQATQARDPKSFVDLPAGDCGKIAGGSLSPA